ncbi:MAG: serine hydrolase [Pseudomonadota bacterium]
MAMPFAVYGWWHGGYGETAARTANMLAVADGAANRSVMEAPIDAADTGPPAPRRLADEIAMLGAAFDGDVGIAIRAVEKGWVVGHDAGRRYPQQSVSKLWVALTTLDQVDSSDIALDEPMTLTRADLTIFHQPIRSRIGNGSYTTDIAELLTLAMTRSDNTANDALFRRAGGQPAVQRFLADNKLDGIAVSPGEKTLQMRIAGMQWDDSFSTGRTFWRTREQIPMRLRARSLGAYLADPLDGATPLAITEALARLQRGELLSPEMTAYLIGLMTQSKTGPKRLRGGLEAGWTLPHKTGTGQDLAKLSTAYNDVGLLVSSSGNHYALAVMIGATNRPIPERQVLMQAVTRAVIRCEEEGWPGC